MKKRQFLIVLISTSILAISIGAKTFLASLKEEAEFRKPPKAKKYVKTQTTEFSSLETSIFAYGRVQSAQNVDLLSEVSGRMFEGSVRLKEGQKFRKGALLFSVDDREAALNLKSQKSNFLRDIASILPDFKVDFEKSFDAWSAYFNSINIDEDLPELPEINSEKEKTFLATKGIFSAFYSIKSAEVRLKKHKYYAPFEGSVTEVAMQSGSFINAGTRIGRIMRSDALELKVAVETKDISWVQVGTEAEITSGEAQLAFNAEVIRVSDYVNPNTQSVDVYLKIFQGQSKIYDGQFLEAEIPTRTIQNGMTIPRNVIYNGDEVFVLQDTLLKIRQIDIYRLMEEDAIIGGIEEGVELVVEPLVNAHNNMVMFKLDRSKNELGKKTNSDLEAKSEN
ncbi:MAG: HlyD family efflux transporter periplasmic adaptor subunit [Cyclobacteriaceae bacterium]